MVTSNILSAVIVIGGAIGIVVILSAFFELRRRMRKKIAAESENQA